MFLIPRAFHWYVTISDIFKTKKDIVLRAIALHTKMFFIIRALHWYVTIICILTTKKVIPLRAIALKHKNVHYEVGFTLVCCNDIYC